MSKLIFGITGQIAAGKDTVANYIISKTNAKTFKFSQVLRDVLKRIHQESTRDNMQKLSTYLRQNFGEDILAKIIYEDIKSSNDEVIVIDGVRRYADIESLKQLDGFKLVYVDTSLENRYIRITQRMENADDKTKTFDDFKKDNEQEAESQISDLKNIADIIIDNNGSVEELYKQIDGIV